MRNMRIRIFGHYFSIFRFGEHPFLVKKLSYGLRNYKHAVRSLGKKAKAHRTESIHVDGTIDRVEIKRIYGTRNKEVSVYVDGYSFRLHEVKLCKK